MKINKVDIKQVSISSYSDLSKLSKRVNKIHFRKFISKKILRKVLINCPNLDMISFSKYAFSRCNEKILEQIQQRGVKLKISLKDSGRPNLVERIHPYNDVLWQGNEF